PRVAHEAMFAAGLDTRIFASPRMVLVQPYGLHSFEPELAMSLPLEGRLQSVAMGSASHGPLLLQWAAGKESWDPVQYTFFDIQNMTPLPWQAGTVEPGTYDFYQVNVHVRSSPDSSVFGLWCS